MFFEKKNCFWLKFELNWGFWMAEDDVMHITLTKRDKGQTWASPIMGQGQLDPYVTDQEQKRLMLQRFQEEVNYHWLLFIVLVQF